MTEKLPLPKKPKGPAGIFFWWLKKLFLFGARTICPRCEKGKIFESHFKVCKRCPECKVLLQPYPGDELGVVALGYFLTVFPSLLALVLIHLYLDWSAAAELGFFFLMMTGIMVGFYPNIKGMWIGFVFLLTGLRKRL